MIKETFSPEETFAFGKWIGENALPGQVYTLVGDLGVGKTVFTQGVAEGLGITEPVNSPTFTIIQEYESEGLFGAECFFYHKFTTPFYLQNCSLHIIIERITKYNTF